MQEDRQLSPEPSTSPSSTPGSGSATGRGGAARLMATLPGTPGLPIIEESSPGLNASEALSGLLKLGLPCLEPEELERERLEATGLCGGADRFTATLPGTLGVPTKGSSLGLKASEALSGLLKLGLPRLVLGESLERERLDATGLWGAADRFTATFPGRVGAGSEVSISAASGEFTPVKISLNGLLSGAGADRGWEISER